MRTYEIINADGVKVGEQTHDDSMAPALLAGHSARLIELDGEKLARTSRPMIGPEADAVPASLVTEAEAAAAREKAKAEKEAAKAAAAETDAANSEANPKDKPTT